MNSTTSLILSKEDAKKLTRKDLEESTFYVMKGDDDEKKYAKVNVNEDQISFDEWQDEIEEGSFCVKFFDFINSRTSVIDTHKFITEQHNKELHNPKLPKDRIKYSKIEVKYGGVYFDSFKTSEQSDFVVEFGSLLKTLGCSYVLPAEAFLKPQSLNGEEFVITTDGGTPRALNFLLLASGIMDRSYQGTQIRNYGIEVVGGYDKDGFSFPSIVEGIQDGGIFERKETKRGDVIGRYEKNPNNLSFFSVCKEDNSSPSPATFGRVIRGMEIVDQIDGYNYKESVKECGLLLGFRNETHQKEVLVN